MRSSSPLVRLAVAAHLREISKRAEARRLKLASRAADERAHALKQLAGDVKRAVASQRPADLEQTVAALRATTPGTQLAAQITAELIAVAQSRLKCLRSDEDAARAGAAGRSLLKELAGPELDARRRNCECLHRLRCRGWRPTPDGRWRAPWGEDRELVHADAAARPTFTSDSQPPANPGGPLSGASRKHAAERGEGEASHAA